MAINNRAEAIIVAEATLVPTLTLTQHKTMLNDNILNSVKFDKDVIASETPVAGAVTIDYEDKDMATVTTAVDLAVSFTNLENGAVKYLEITKAAANVISFVGALDKVAYRDYINTVETVVCYRISNKNGTIYVEALFAPDSTSFIDLTLNSSYFSGYARYRQNNFSGKIELEISVTCLDNGTAGQKIATLPSNIKPDRNLYLFLNCYSGLTSESRVITCRLGSTTGDIDPSITLMEESKVYYAYFEYYITLP